MARAGVVFAYVLTLGLVLLSRLAYENPQRKELRTAVELRKAAGVPPSTPLPFVIGFNGAVDLIVPAADLLSALGLGDVLPAPTDHVELQSLTSLAECFKKHFTAGGAAERWFANKTLFDSIVQTASSLPSAQYHTGGNAALISQHLVSNPSTAQCRSVVLYSMAGPKLRALLPSAVATPDHLLTQQDEVHIIMEYPKGHQWGGSVSPKANRFIFSHDVTNARLLALDQVLSFPPSIPPRATVVLSGVHMLEGLAASQRVERLDALLQFIHTLPATSPVHLELASIGDLSLLRHVGQRVFSAVTSLGLNEQELASVAIALNYTRSSLEDLSPAVVADVLHWLLDIYGVSEGRSSQLSRIHFHCLTYHIIATVHGRWLHSASAVAAASLSCSMKACDVQSPEPSLFDVLFPEKFSLSLSGSSVRTYDPDEPVLTWSQGMNDFHLSPVLVCKKPLKTVGLGDSISATGLEYSIYAPPPRA